MTARKRNVGTTTIGYVNKHRQTVKEKTDREGTDHRQRVYILMCGNCANEYGANGSDNWQRKCPKCQGGRPGI